MFRIKLKNFQKIILSLSLAIGISLIVFWLFYFKILNIVDLQMTDKMFVRESISDEVMIVSIDNRSIQSIGHWPWPRNVHGKLIAKLEESGAKVIGYDVTFAEKGLKDEEFFEIINQYENLVFPLEGALILKKEKFPDFKEILLPLPEILEKHSVGHTILVANQDGKVRRAPLFINLKGELKSPFFLEILKKAGMAIGRVPESFSCAVAVDGRLYFLDQFGLYRIFFFGPQNTFRKFSFIDVLDNKVDPEMFKNKIVLVGAEAPDLHDEYFTPSSGNRPMSGVEILANTIESFLQRKTLQEVTNPAIVFLMLFGLALLSAFTVFYFRLRFALPLFFPYIFLYIIAATVAFGRGLVLPIFYPLLVLILVYGLGVVLRYILIKEEKRKLRKYFSLYVARDVVDEILAHPEKVKLGGETKNLTILFSDIRGFTSVAEKMDAQKLVSFLNEYLTAMAKIVLENRGVVDKFIGDAIMAFWGAPLPLSNHAETAVRTALLMRHRLKECNEEWKKFNYPEIKIGLGINTGEAVVGNIGSHERFDYTVIGDNVNLASRLEGLTKFYGSDIIISESTAKEVANKFVLRLLDYVAVKGKVGGVKIYEVLGFLDEQEKFTNLISQYQMAFDLYLAKQWGAAKKIFEKLLVQYPNDVPSQIFKIRLEKILSNPPVDFDGIYRLDFK